MNMQQIVLLHLLIIICCIVLLHHLSPSYIIIMIINHHHLSASLSLSPSSTNMIVIIIIYHRLSSPSFQMLPQSEGQGLPHSLTVPVRYSHVPSLWRGVQPYYKKQYTEKQMRRKEGVIVRYEVGNNDMQIVTYRAVG